MTLVALEFSKDAHKNFHVILIVNIPRLRADLCTAPRYAETFAVRKRQNFSPFQPTVPDGQNRYHCRAYH